MQPVPLLEERAERKDGKEVAMVRLRERSSALG
jgi:hypothetical protein